MNGRRSTRTTRMRPCVFEPHGDGGNRGPYTEWLPGSFGVAELELANRSHAKFRQTSQKISMLNLVRLC